MPIIYFCIFNLAPASPPSNVMVTAVSPTSILVTWAVVPPIDQNGVITMYEVLYEPLETFNGVIMSNTTTVDATARAVILMDLKEYVVYNISVRAYTGVGAGPYSVEIMERTNEDGEKLNLNNDYYYHNNSVLQPLLHPLPTSW